VQRAEALLPGFAGTQILSVMVLIARQAFDFASEAAARGAAAQATQHDHTLYPGNGLLWLRGLTAAARGQLPAALDDFRAEVNFSSHTATVYARESLVLAREAEGFTLLGLGDSATARDAFAGAEAASPGHARAQLGLAVANGAARQAGERVAAACATLAESGKHGEQALVMAAALGWAGNPDDGVAHAEAALSRAGTDSTGWSLPADPMFAPLRSSAGYPRLLARLASRAS
jgi:tetratricopeptide (TPR) repeat protein